MIKKADKAEFLDCLRDKSVVDRLHLYPDDIRNKYNYVVEIDGNKLFFGYIKKGKKTAEMHIAAKKEHRKNVKYMIKLALGFMKRQGFNRIITWAPEIYPETINLGIKLGFNEYHREYTAFYQCDAVYLEKVL